MARIPRPHVVDRDNITHGHASALRILYQYSNVPVPKVFGFGMQVDQNPYPYIIMEAPEGRPLGVVEKKFQEGPLKVFGGKEAAVRKICEQLTDILVEVGTLSPFLP